MFLIHSDTLVAVEDNYKCNAVNAMFNRDRDTERNLRFRLKQIVTQYWAGRWHGTEMIGMTEAY